MINEKNTNFLEDLIHEELKSGKFPEGIITRFPPEPNGYLHIGHAKSICLNFGLGESFQGKTNLRFDDTNPETEETEYVESIQKDIEWLGFKWAELNFTSDYFDQLYGFALKLIRKGKAYVDDSSAEEIAAMKGTPIEPGKNSPYRDRSVEENLRLFEAMKNGDFEEGSKVLRAKIDMASPNMHLRDPFLYRIKKAAHHRTGDKWKIYPMYDFAHGQSDSIEHITHSICTLEFEVHRPLYDWLIQELEIYPSRQFEFARLSLNYTVTSKRKLLRLVRENHVQGWDDPRMPTISGMRRRGYTPESIRAFCQRIGVARRENIVDMGLLEFCVREDLNAKAHRRMVVTDPLIVIIKNMESGAVEWLPGENNPEVEGGEGTRKIPFSREILIEREDFMEIPPKKFFRLFPGGMVRLKHAFIIRCDEFIKDESGNLKELHCTYFPESRSGQDKSGISVKGTLHWVSASHATEVELRLYERLFRVEDPSASEAELETLLNPDSLTVIKGFAEPAVTESGPMKHLQFLRKGYFIEDPESSQEKRIFNRTVTLKDGWSAEPKKE